MSQPLNESQEQAIYAALFGGQKILAIKQYREASGASLMEAKEFIEALEMDLRRESPEKFKHAKKSGCTVQVGAFALAALAGLAWLAR